MESRTLNPRFHAAPPPSPSLWSVRISSVFGFSHRIEDHQIRRYLRRVISFKPRGVARYISWEVNELNALRVGRRQLPWASHIRVGANASAVHDYAGGLGTVTDSSASNWGVFYGTHQTRSTYKLIYA
ncbi:unnamed protein product [Musa hybrid cultivar]